MWGKKDRQGYHFALISKLIQNYCGKITKDDVERDDLLQSEEQHQKTKVMTKKQSFTDIKLILMNS